MNSASTLLSHYRAVVAAAGKMREQARSGDWDEVARTARSIQHLTEQLDTHRRNAPALSLAADRERVRLLAEMIRIDAEVRQLRQPWVQKLDDMLGSAQQRSFFGADSPNSANS